MHVHHQNSLDELPEQFMSRLQRILPEAVLPSVLQSFTRPSAVGFRVNTRKAEVDAVRDALEEEGLEPRPVAWWDHAFWLSPEERDRLLATDLYRREMIYVQNLSSMLPPLVLAPQPGERVLDLTAAPGSKTLQMACLMGGEGELAAVEVVRTRFFKLKDNLKRQGASEVRTYLQNGERVWRYRPEYFDRVLLDAPCSSEGRFHASRPESYQYWSTRKIREMSRKQRRLLYSGIQSLRPDGHLVYSTCAFAPEENEAAIANALQQFDGAIEVEPINLNVENRIAPLPSWEGASFPEAVRHSMRIVPNETMEGFFVCRLRKVRSTLDKRGYG